MKLLIVFLLASLILSSHLSAQCCAESLAPTSEANTNVIVVDADDYRPLYSYRYSIIIVDSTKNYEYLRDRSACPVDSGTFRLLLQFLTDASQNPLLNAPLWASRHYSIRVEKDGVQNLFFAVRGDLIAANFFCELCEYLRTNRCKDVALIDSFCSIAEKNSRPAPYLRFQAAMNYPYRKRCLDE